MRTSTLALVTPLLGALCAAPAPGVAQNAVGLDAVFSDQNGNSIRNQNAVGFGPAYTLDLLPLPSVFGKPARFKVMGAVDLEIVTGELEKGFCPNDTLTGEFHFYRECNPPLRSVDPSVAEASASMRVFAGVFAVVDVWRIRAGWAPWTGHVGANPSDHSTSALLGFAMTPVSWVMVELPEHGGFRIRIEASIWADPLSTF